jgi:asparagine synthase (glutamine-hydrolysing)
MCGICGVFDPGGIIGPLKDAVLRMAHTITHRGPDAHGSFVDGALGLGHCRLAIIDLSENGAQPMTVGSATIAYNGEAFNFRELRKELEEAGRVFRGHSDTEVVLQAYHEWGLEGLARLEGQFAFALWDRRIGRLVLIRDRLGIKPLFYAQRGQQLAFASEIKAIFAAVPCDRSVDEQALAEYLWYGNSFEDRTIYRGVRALPPGHRLIIEGGQTRVEPWWRIEDWLRSPAPRANRQEAAVAVREAVDAAVSRQLVSDVPVGIFLSGGIDSSSIAASAALAAGRRLRSYSVGFDFAHGVQELPKARVVAAHLGLDHHELHIQGGSMDEVLVALVSAHDEPFADAANIPLYLLSRQLNGAAKVVLQGDGGDEMFGGYRRYAILRYAALWKMWPPGFENVVRALPGRTAARLARMGAAAGADTAAMSMALLLTTETLRDPPTAMLVPGVRQSFESRTDPFLAYHRCAERFLGADPVQRMLLTDISLQLPSQFLTKVDRATMSHGVEARVPLLDERVAALAVNMPSSFKVRNGQKKIVLRDAMRERLPGSVLDGPKTGFGVPYEHWLRGSLHAFARGSILERNFVERFGLDGASLRLALDEHQSGRRDRGFLLWKLLQLSLWSTRYLP